MARPHIGTSGWNYKHWMNGVFYPSGMKQADWLAHYYAHFDTVEINNSFYRLPSRETFEKWRESTPDNFLFAVKASRFLTHMKKLMDVEVHGDLLMRNAAGLGKKLGIVLFQLPPRFRYSEERLEGLLRFMHRQKRAPGTRAALEVRDGSWLVDSAYALLRKYNASLVLADWPALPTPEIITANFVFLRRHGSHATPYTGEYSEEQIQDDARKIRDFLKQGRDVYMYYNNDAGGHAMRNALRLKEIL